MQKIHSLYCIMICELSLLKILCMLIMIIVFVKYYKKVFLDNNVIEIFCHHQYFTKFRDIIENSSRFRVKG